MSTPLEDKIIKAANNSALKFLDKQIIESYSPEFWKNDQLDTLEMLKEHADRQDFNLQQALNPIGITWKNFWNLCNKKSTITDDTWDSSYRVPVVKWSGGFIKKREIGHGDVVYKVHADHDSYYLLVSKAYEGPNGLYIHPNHVTDSVKGWSLSEAEAFEFARSSMKEYCEKHIALINALEEKEKKHD